MGLKYAQNIVTQTRATSTQFERVVVLEPSRSTIGVNRILQLDSEVVDGAFYVECSWFYEGVSEYPIEETHVHDFDEVLGFIGSDPKNPSDLGAEIEIWLDDEKHVINKSCLVFIPKGLKHCPLTLRKVDKPILFMGLGPTGIYKRLPEVDVAEVALTPLNARSNGEPKYLKYIVTEMKKKLSFPPPPPNIPPNASKLTRFLYLDSEVVDGAFYVEYVWFSEGIGSGSPPSHVHDFDEVLGFIGSDPKNPSDLGAEIEIWLDDEKHVINKSCLVFIPKGLKHCPIIQGKADRSYFHFSAGPTILYQPATNYQRTMSNSSAR